MTLRTKLTATTLAVVAVTTALALLAVQVPVETMQRRALTARFTATLRTTFAIHEARLAAVRARCRRLARSVRLVAALAEGEAEPVYRTAQDELRDVLGAASDPASRARFFRLLDARGQPVVPPEEVPTGPAPAALGPALATLGAAATARQSTGWLLDDGGTVEVVTTPISDPATGAAVGALVVGFPFGVPDPDEPPDDVAIVSALWIDGRLVGDRVPVAARPMLEAALRGWRGGPLPRVIVDGTPALVLAEALDVGRGFPPAAQVAFASLGPAERERRRLRLLVLASGAGGLVLALVMSSLLAGQLVRPVRALVAGTDAVARGDFDGLVATEGSDEIGDLARAFNHMARGLAQRERYRRLLDLVADPAVAEQLVAGGVELGGEERVAGVLFCDIRGFTTLTAALSPAEVITMVNEHMTAMTRVIHAHGGVVDKFVGDLVMAVFGAPRASGREGADLARCALAIVTERARLNDHAARPFDVGIGITLGTVVAGCTGAAERLSYTVLGERVNGASRLCQAAGPGEILLDDETRERLGPTARVEPLAPIAAKGYAEPMAAWRLVAWEVAAA